MSFSPQVHSLSWCSPIPGCHSTRNNVQNQDLITDGRAARMQVGFELPALSLQAAVLSPWAIPLGQAEISGFSFAFEGRPYLVVLKAYSWLCTQDSHLVELRELYSQERWTVDHRVCGEETTWCHIKETLPWPCPIGWPLRYRPPCAILWRHLQVLYSPFQCGMQLF